MTSLSLLPFLPLPYLLCLPLSLCLSLTPPQGPVIGENVWLGDKEACRTA